LTTWPFILGLFLFRLTAPFSVLLHILCMHMLPLGFPEAATAWLASCCACNDIMLIISSQV